MLQVLTVDEDATPKFLFSAQHVVGVALWRTKNVAAVPAPRPISSPAPRYLQHDVQLQHVCAIEHMKSKICPEHVVLRQAFTY